jgi:uncharacterized protein (TIGR03437 family)
MTPTSQSTTATVLPSAPAAGCSWSVSFSGNFIVFQGPTSGTISGSNFTFSYSVSANTGVTPRQGTLTVSINGAVVGTPTISQNSTTCTYAVSPTSENVPSSGGGGTFQITTTPPGCVAFFSFSAPGLIVNSVVGQVVTWAAQANTGPARQWVLTLSNGSSPGSTTFTLNQPAVGSSGGLALNCNPPIGPTAINSYTEEPYLTTCTATGGTPPYAMSLGPGTLPQGLTLQSSGGTGTIQGVSINPGIYQFSVKVVDSASATASFQFNGTQTPETLLVNFPAAPPAYTNTSFSASGSAEGGTRPYTWSVTAGALPAGFALTPNGTSANFQGSTLTPESYSYTLQVSDSGTPQLTQKQSYSGAIVPQPLSILANSQPGPGRVNQLYDVAFIAEGGTAPFNWSLSGSLPGVSLSTTNQVGTYFTGSPTTEGTYTFTIGLTDSGVPRQSASQTYTVTVTTGMRMSCAPPFNAVVKAIFSVTCTIVSNEVPPFYWTLFSTSSLPAGVVFPTNPTGSTLTISGTPTATGPFQMTIGAGKTLSGNQPQLFAETQVSGTIVLPSLTVAPAALTFTASTSDTTPPAVQTVAISGSPAGTPFIVSVPPNQSWLFAAAVSGQFPGSISVSVNPASLSPGHLYQSEVVISVLGEAEAVIQVSLAYDLGAAGQLGTASDHLPFASAAGGPAILSEVQVTNLEGGTISYTATSTVPWLVLSGTSGSATSSTPGRQVFSVNPIGLATGTYHGGITFQNGSQTVTVPVILAVSPAAQSIAVIPNNLTFTVARPAVQSLAVLDTGQSTMSWQATTQTLAGGSWLKAAPSTGSSAAGANGGALPNVAVDPTGLAAGPYYGIAQVGSSSAGNSPQSISVLMNVVNPLFAGGPVVSPHGILLVNSPATVTLTMLGSGQGTYSAQASTDDGANWLGLSPASGTIAPYSSSTIVLQPNPTGLAPGLRTGKVQFTFADGSQDSVSVSLLVQNLVSGACQPSSLIPTLATLPNNFQVAAGLATNLQVTLTDDCGTAISSAQVSMTLNTGDPPLELTPLSGTWFGTWIPRSPLVINMTIQAFTSGASQPLSGRLQLSGITEPPSPTAPPVAATIVNSASYLSSGVISPGSWISIFGDRLSPVPSSSNPGSYPANLGGTQVSLGNTLLPLSYAGPGQINALVPNGIATSTEQTLLVQTTNALSVPSQVIVADVLPAIYTTSSQGTGQGAILISGTASLAAAVGAYPGSRPVQTGEYLSIYCSGLGAVANAPPDGQPAPSTPPFATISETPTVVIGGVTASAANYAGLAPGEVGLYQVNVQLPSGVPPGSAVPVQIAMGSAVSNIVTIAVQ